jgi:hypothetical protein
MAAPELDLTQPGLAEVVPCPSAGHLRPTMINLRTNATAVELRSVVKAAEKTGGLRMLALDSVNPTSFCLRAESAAWRGDGLLRHN